MKDKHTKRTVRLSILAVAALTAAGLPLLASAAASSGFDTKADLFSDPSSQSVSPSESLYDRLKAQSRKVCGESDLLLTGSVRRSAGIEECYEGTLTAAVERLGDAHISALHDRESAAL